jgi:hypothetical protein
MGMRGVGGHRVQELALWIRAGAKQTFPTCLPRRRRAGVRTCDATSDIVAKMLASQKHDGDCVGANVKMATQGASLVRVANS